MIARKIIKMGDRSITYEVEAITMDANKDTSLSEVIADTFNAINKGSEEEA